MWISSHAIASNGDAERGKQQTSRSWPPNKRSRERKRTRVEYSYSYSVLVVHAMKDNKKYSSIRLLRLSHVDYVVRRQTSFRRKHWMARRAAVRKACEPRRSQPTHSPLRTILQPKAKIETCNKHEASLHHTLCTRNSATRRSNEEIK